MKKYTLTVGLLDKDTKTQKVSILEAYKVVENATVSIVGYGTIYESRGVYTHDDGTVVVEPSLRVDVSTDEKSKVVELAKFLKVALNQESIMFEEVVTLTDFI